MGPAVVKIGGSLYGEPARLVRVLDWIRRVFGPGVVVVPGGGGYADAVRRMQRREGIADDEAHVAALAAMDSAGRWLARDHHFGRCEAALEALAVPGGEPVVFVGACGLATDPSLPRSWATTSDSVALRIAQLIDSKELTLVKSCPPPAADLATLAAAGYLDHAFPARFHAAPVPVVFADAGNRDCDPVRTFLKFPADLDDIRVSIPDAFRQST